jgi:glycosyltransferase involved in cell wall biosynthesis
MHTEEKVDVSIIMTVCEAVDDVASTYEGVSVVLRRLNKTYEFLFVEHADSPHARAKINSLRDSFPRQVRMINLRSVFGESDALSAGFAHARGKLVLVIPAYFQIDLREIDRLLLPLDTEYDLVSARRIKRKDSALNRAESRVFNWLVRRLIGVEVHDLGSGVVAMRKEVADSLDMYGDMFRFIPILAHRQGYKITEALLTHVPRRKKSGLYAPGIYVRRLLDIVTLFFVIKFTKKPLRFFGLNGAAIFFLGTVINLYLVFYKFLGNPVANRPLLILGTLFMVLGIQLVSIGLIGELVIFVHARKLKEYRIEKIVE